MILNFVPIYIWIILAIFSVSVYLISNFLRFIPIPVLKLYKLPIQLISLSIFVITIFIIGIVINENSWQEKLRIEQEKYNRIKLEQKILNTKLGEETAAKMVIIKDSAIQLKRQSDNFAQAIKAKDATVQNIINSFDQAAKAKYEALSVADREKINKEMQEAINFQKNCPVVPEVYVNRLNNSAQNLTENSVKK